MRQLALNAQEVSRILGSQQKRGLRSAETRGRGLRPELMGGGDRMVLKTERVVLPVLYIAKNG